jgi:hypothetical protein
MNSTKEIEISQLMRTISLLKWDLAIVKNKEIKAQKESKLRLYEQKLEELLKQTAS